MRETHYVVITPAIFANLYSFIKKINSHWLKYESRINNIIRTKDSFTQKSLRNPLRNDNEFHANYFESMKFR